MSKRDDAEIKELNRKYDRILNPNSWQRAGVGAHYDIVGYVPGYIGRAKKYNYGYYFPKGLIWADMAIYQEWVNEGRKGTLYEKIRDKIKEFGSLDRLIVYYMVSEQL